MARGGVAGAHELVAACQRLGHLVGRLLGGAHDVEVAVKHLVDGGGEQGEVRAAQHERVDVGVQQRLQPLPHDLQRLLSHEDVSVLQPVFMQVVACRQLFLHKRHEAGRCQREHVDACVELVDGAGVGVALHGERGGDDADLPRDACLDGRARPGSDDAYDGHAERALRQRQRGRRRGVAGDDHELYALRREPGSDLPHERADFLGGAHAVGAAFRVAHVEDGLVGQQGLDGAGDGEAAHARVEDADGGALGPLARVARAGRDVQGVRDAPPFHGLPARGGR